MEHARKMILIPEEKLKQLKQEKKIIDSNENCKSDQESLSVQTPGTVFSRLDKDMSEILNSQDINDSDKWHLYYQVLQRFLQFFGNGRSMKLIENKNECEEKDEKEENKEIKEIKDDTSYLSEDTHIIESVPVKYQSKAKQLLLRLRRAGEDHISWDKNDKVFINGQILEGSNIIDLINDAMRPRKAHIAVGRSEFAQLIKTIGIPKEFVGNTEFWKDKEVRDTPTASKRKVSTVVRRLHKEGDDEKQYYSADEEAIKETNDASLSPNSFETPAQKKPKTWFNFNLPNNGN